jgi:hemerythrin superfamily protein
MKATDLLEKQHRKVESIFEKLESGKNSPALVEELVNNLAAHMAIEHELFYPAARQADEKIVLESFEEHALAEVALKRLLSTDPNDPSFQARVKAAKELIAHHVEEEEEQMFPQVEEAIESAALIELGELMAARFEAVLEQGFTKVVPEGYEKTSADAARPVAMAAE